MSLFDVVAATGVTLSGVGAGIFCAFSTGIMPGLARTDDTTFVSSMRAINRAVINPLFLGPIFLPPVLLGAAGVTATTTAASGLLLAATAVFGAGVVAVTMVGNVPLNTALDRSTAAVGAARAAFERRWRARNHIRSVSATAATLLAAMALVVESAHVA